MSFPFSRLTTLAGALLVGLASMPLQAAYTWDGTEGINANVMSSSLSYGCGSSSCHGATYA